MNEKETQLESSCEVCGGHLKARRFAWLVECSDCKLLIADMNPYLDSDANSGYDSDAHSSAFQALREENSQTTFEFLDSLDVSSKTLLEVGSAQGYFLKAAEKAGLDCLGLEPNFNLYEMSIKNGHSVVQGFFPQDVPKNTVHDILVFNDVFEHIPNARNTIKKSRDHLNRGGILVLNLPMRDGVFYTLGRITSKLGWNVPFERLWQVGTMSPHIYYFDKKNLTALAENGGFKLIGDKRLKTLTINGLWKRLRVTSNFSTMVSAFIWLSTIIIYPLLAILPADARLLVFQKTD